MSCLKVVVLGSAGCGKTSLIHRFMYNQFPNSHLPTTKANYYYPGVFADNEMYELKVVDTPPMEVFPRSTLEDWTMNGSHSVRNAHAYLIMFDVTSWESFRLAKALRDQLQTSAYGSVILIVANKADRLPWLQNLNKPSSHSVMVNPVSGNFMANGMPLHNQPGVIGGSLTVSGVSSNPGSNRSSVDAMDQFRKELSSIIKKQWKCPFVECSAKWNWNVITVFHDLVNLIKRNRDFIGAQPGSGSSNSHAGLKVSKKRCHFFCKKKQQPDEAKPG